MNWGKFRPSVKMYSSLSTDKVANVFLKPQGAVHASFNPPPTEGLYLLPDTWGAPFRGMLTGPKAFLCSLGMSGLWPCAWTHLKIGLVPHLSGRWDVRQIPKCIPALVLIKNSTSETRWLPEFQHFSFYFLPNKNWLI